jgi:hypothetical protein
LDVLITRRQASRQPGHIPSRALFVAACAFIGAVYLVGDVTRRGHDDLVPYFGRRAILSGGVTGVLAAVNLALLHGSAPYIFGRLTGVALPLVIVSVLAGAAAVALIVLGPAALRRTRPGPVPGTGARGAAPRLLTAPIVAVAAIQTLRHRHRRTGAPG